MVAGELISQVNVNLVHSCRFLRIAIDRLVRCRKGETLSLHQVSQGFVISECEWLIPTGERAQNQRPVASDMLKRRELLEDFLYWFFESFVLPLIKASLRERRANLSP